jgi:hypothetical protein
MFGSLQLLLQQELNSLRGIMEIAEKVAHLLNLNNVVDCKGHRQ